VAAREGSWDEGSPISDEEAGAALEAAEVVLESAEAEAAEEGPAEAAAETTAAAVAVEQAAVAAEGAYDSWDLPLPPLYPTQRRVSRKSASPSAAYSLS
jgi:hypothetical protein